MSYILFSVNYSNIRGEVIYVVLFQICLKENETKLSSFMWVFLIGNLFHGAGASPLFTLGVTFIDESVVKKKSGLYMGICCYELIAYIYEARIQYPYSYISFNYSLKT